MEKTIFLMEAETLLTKSKKMVRVQDLIHAPDDGKADGQGEKDILMVRISQSAKQCQVKGNFREEGEEEQAQQVLASATRVQQPFDEQKAKDRKSTPADDAQKGIELVGKEITVEEKRDAVVVGGKGEVGGRERRGRRRPAPRWSINMVVIATIFRTLPLIENRGILVSFSITSLSMIQ